MLLFPRPTLSLPPDHRCHRSISSTVVLCAKYDGVSLSTAIVGEGSCWSTGGAMPYAELGMAAGATTGIGLTGCLWLIIALCRSPAQDKDQIQMLKSVAVDVAQDVESVVTGVCDHHGEGSLKKQ